MELLRRNRQHANSGFLDKAAPDRECCPVVRFALEGFSSMASDLGIEIFEE